GDERAGWRPAAMEYLSTFAYTRHQLSEQFSLHESPSPFRMAAQAAIIRANSFRVAPNANSERISRSSETDVSPFSIFATRDWLDPSNWAIWTCVSCLACRYSHTFSLRASFNSR